jgi:hypothetical protein
MGEASQDGVTTSKPSIPSVDKDARMDINDNGDKHHRIGIQALSKDKTCKRRKQKNKKHTLSEM